MGRRGTSARSIIQIPSPGFHNRGPLVSLNGELASHSVTGDPLAWTCFCKILNTATGPAKFHGGKSTSEGTHGCWVFVQRLAAVMGRVAVVCYFREGPFCILKKGLGFSLALT